MTTEQDERFEQIFGKILTRFERAVDESLELITGQTNAANAQPTEADNQTPSGAYRITSEELTQLLRAARTNTLPSAQQQAQALLDRCTAAVARTTRDDIIREYAHTTLFVGDDDKAMQLYTRLEHPTNRELAVLGIHAFEKEQVADAAKYLARARTMAPTDALPERLIVESRLQLRQGTTQPAAHVRILAPVLSTSYDAALLLGVLQYNDGSLSAAEQNFRVARSVDRLQPDGHRHLITTTIAIGKDPSVHVHAYRHSTQDTRSADDIVRECTVGTLPIPPYKRNRSLYALVA